MTFEVLDVGLLTTIQDGGRPGFGHIGVPLGGAADPIGLAVANIVLGNDPDAAALEMTIAGPVLAVHRETVVGVGGADLGGVVQPGGRRLEPGAAYRLAAGSTIAFPRLVSGSFGMRCYLAVPGGFDMPVVLGSRSTCLVAGFGGLEGRALRTGDVVGAAADAPGAGTTTARGVGTVRRNATGATVAAATVRVFPGPFGGIDMHALDDLCAAVWTVGRDSDRMGIRLEGPLLQPGRGMVSHGVTWGTIQLPPGGGPIVLLADHQPTGGYPVVAVAITADRPILGQLAPGQQVRFEVVDVEAARAALVAQRKTLDELAVAVSEERRWLDSAGWAGA